MVAAHFDEWGLRLVLFNLQIWPLITYWNIPASSETVQKCTFLAIRH
jgi:hypothetical protein